MTARGLQAPASRPRRHRDMRWRRGQIAIPALLMIPTLMIFVFLIFETAKISREKIRHQFAIDAASFVEMTNYSDFLNRSAYVNGAFPMRIFREGFHDTILDCFGRDPCNGNIHLDDLLYGDGAFPRDPADPDGNSYRSTTGPPGWNIEFDPSSPRGGMDTEQPDTDSHNTDCDASPCLTLISLQSAKGWNLNWDDANQIYKLYVQIYQLLGSVESAQYSVLKRLASDHNFLKKSYWLNSGGPQALNEAESAKASFGASADGFMGAVRFGCVDKIIFYGNQLVHNFGQPYQIFSNKPGTTMPSTIGECSGLFQVVTVNKNMLSSMTQQSGPLSIGWPVVARWTAPNNYFGVDLNQMMNGVDDGPKVHASVSIWRGVKNGRGPASVWTLPTPKFQVRLYP